VRLAALALLAVAMNATAAEGCWAQFFSQPSFKGPMHRLSGSVYINSISAPGYIGELALRDYFSRARSVSVGPRAQLILYAARGFDQEIGTLEPGRQVADLSTIGFHKRVVSLKVVCERP
jgi:hypothetical protein